MNAKLLQYAHLVKFDDLDSMERLLVVETRQLIDDEGTHNFTVDEFEELREADRCLHSKADSYGKALFKIRGYNEDRVRFARSKWWWHLDSVGV